MRAEKIVKDLRELQLLQAALTRVADYQPGKVRVRVDFAQDQIKSAAVRRVIDETATEVIKTLATTDQMRAKMTQKISARIEKIEQRHAAALAGGE